MIATKHRYANGTAYRPNLYVIRDETRDFRVLGGMIVLKDKAIAYVGAGHLVESKISSIVAYADHYVWGATPAKALAKIKPFLGA